MHYSPLSVETKLLQTLVHIALQSWDWGGIIAHWMQRLELPSPVAARLGGDGKRCAGRPSVQTLNGCRKGSRSVWGYGAERLVMGGSAA